MMRSILALLVMVAANAVCAAQDEKSGAATTSTSAEQGWPAKPIRFIVPFPPGSATDAAARVIAQKLGQALAQQMVVDNRAGASGSIGCEMAARATPDGYTLVLGTASTHAVAASVNSHLRYDPVRDFSPVSLVGSSPYVLAVHPAVAANSVQKLIALAKTRPGQLSYSSAGNASLAHLAGELFATMAGVKLNHIPYKSSALSVIDVLSGRIELQFGSISPTLPHIRSGRLRALAVTGATRLTNLPDVPTVAQSGLRGYEVTLWMGILAPAATSPAIVSRLNREVTAILRAADVKDALVAQGVEPSPSTPIAFATHIRNEIAKWRKVVTAAGVYAQLTPRAVALRVRIEPEQAQQPHQHEARDQRPPMRKHDRQHRCCTISERQQEYAVMFGALIGGHQRKRHKNERRGKYVNYDFHCDGPVNGRILHCPGTDVS
jgi:tripartite-type tricarboxylate transporter receptor subunit TctC